MPVVVDHQPDGRPDPSRHLVGEPLGDRDPVEARRVPRVEGEPELFPGVLHASSPSPESSRSSRAGSTRSASARSWLKVTAPGAEPFTFRTCFTRV